jgi:dienelactone hydrolase
MRAAAEDRCEVLAQNGYVVGAPTYLPVEQTESVMAAGRGARATSSCAPCRS